MSEPAPPDQRVNPYADAPVDHREWQRLDRMMLLVHPIRELIRFLPALIGLVIAGSASGGNAWWWNVLGIGTPIALGIARYLTTSFRIADGRVELRRGLLNKHVLSTPIDRVRTVDVTASPIHRVLGLTDRADRHGYLVEEGGGRARPRRRPGRMVPRPCARSSCTRRPRSASGQRPRTMRSSWSCSSRAGSGTHPSRPPG